MNDNKNTINIPSPKRSLSLFTEFNNIETPQFYEPKTSNIPYNNFILFNENKLELPNSDFKHNSSYYNNKHHKDFIFQSPLDFMHSSDEPSDSENFEQSIVINESKQLCK